MLGIVWLLPDKVLHLLDQLHRLVLKKLVFSEFEKLVGRLVNFAFVTSLPPCALHVFHGVSGLGPNSIVQPRNSY